MKATITINLISFCSNSRPTIIFFISLLLFFGTGHGELYAQGVGINNATPNTTLDVNGDFSLTQSSLSLSGGVHHDLSIGSSSYVRITGPSGPYSISGIAGGEDGKMTFLLNATSHNMILMHENESSKLANRITTPISGNLNIRPMGVVPMIYSAVDSSWIIHSGGKNINTGINDTGSTCRQHTETITTSTKKVTSLPIASGCNTEFIRLEYTGSSNATLEIHGIEAATDGRKIAIFFPSNPKVTGVKIFHDSPDAGAVNERLIVSGSGNSETMKQNGIIELIYSAADNRWISVSYLTN